MAVSRTQRQLCGDHHTRLAVLLYRCSSALPRRAAGSLWCPHSNLVQASSGVPVAEHRPSKHKTTAPRPQQRSARKASPDTPAPAAVELTAAIRACSSPAHLVDLYRLHGAHFTARHAYVALNRLVDVTSSPASGGLDSDAGDVAEREHGWPAQEQAGAPPPTQQLTGRLRVYQGQEFAQPPLHADAATTAAAARQREEELDPHAERRGSNHTASTSASGPSGSKTQQKLLVPQRAKHRADHPHLADQHQHQPQPHQQQQQDEQQAYDEDDDAGLEQQSADDSERAASLAAAVGGAASPHLPPPPQQQQQPPRRVIVSMVSGLAAVLSHACHELDGRGAAETARALSRLRYPDASLLRRLELRALKLMKGPGPSSGSGGKGTAAAAAERKGGTGRHQRGDDWTAGAGSSTSSSNGTSPAAGAASPCSDGSLGSVVEALGRRQQQSESQQRQPGRRGQGANAGGATGGMNADDLYTMVTAFGTMGHLPSEPWRVAVVQATQPHLLAYAASRRGRLPLLISSLGGFGAAPPPEWLRAACAAAQPRLATCPPHQLRALAAGLAAMRHHPGHVWLEAYLAASERQLEDYSAWELVSTVASLAALRCSPGEGWLERFYACTAAMVGTADGLTGRLAAVLLSSLSQLKCRPAGDWLTLLLLGTRRSLGDATAEELTDVLAALARLRFRPPEAWLQQYFTASFQRLPFQTAEQCCAAAVALSMLGRRPQPLWLEELGRHLGSKLALMPAGQQSAAVGALVELGYAPSGAWLEAYEKQSNGRLAENSAEELCRALAALAKVGFQPQASWLYAFILAVYIKLDSFDSAQLALVFDRLPALTTPHGSWVDEIIQICAAEVAMKAAMSSQQEALAQEQQAEEQEQQLQAQQQRQQQAQRQKEAQRQRRQRRAQRQQLAQQQRIAAQQEEQLTGRILTSAGQEAEAEAVVAVFASSAVAPDPNNPVTAAAATSRSELERESTEAAAAAADQASLGLFIAAEAAAIAATGARNGDVVAAGQDDVASRLVQDVPNCSLNNGEPLAAAPEYGGFTPAAAALNGTISISRELVPTANDVLSLAAPFGGDPRRPLLNGAAAAATGMSMGLLRDGLGANMGFDFDAAGDAAELLQRIPEKEDRLLKEPSAAAAVALAALAQGSSGSSGNGSVPADANGSSSNSSNGSSAARRSRRRGDDPGGGGDGDGPPGGRSGGGGSGSDSWNDELLTDVGPGGDDSSRTPDVGLLQRPRAGRATAAAVLALSSSPAAFGATATAAAAAAAQSSLPLASEPTGLMDATQPAVALNGNGSLPGSDLELALEAASALAVPTTAGVPAAATLIPRPKPRPPSTAPQPTSSAAPASMEAPLPGSAPPPSAPGLPGAAGTRVGEASRPLLPFGSAAQGAQPQGEAAAAAAAAADDGDRVVVQYLDSASLSRLIGAPDGPPGPDFSGCQKRAWEGEAARRGGGPGPFQLGRIWTHEGGGGGGAAMPDPVPSPSG